jgi:hypothetical protein
LYTLLVLTGCMCSAATYILGIGPLAVAAMDGQISVYKVQCLYSPVFSLMDKSPTVDQIVGQYIVWYCDEFGT